MSFFSTFFSSENREKIRYTLFSRFPLPFLLSIMLTICGIYQVSIEPESLTTLRVIASLVVTFLLSIGIRLYTEYTQKKNRLSWAWQMLAVFYWVIFYIFFDVQYESLDQIIFFFLHFVGFFSFLYFSPYSREVVGWSENTLEYSNYFTRVAWTFLMAMIVWGALIILGFFAIGAVDYLFDLSTNMQEYYKMYEYWFVLSAAFFAPLFWLVSFPERNSIEKHTYEMNTFFSFLIRFIAIPFITIYFFILYAYTIKVLLQFSEWPKWQVAWMVIAFSIFWYLTYIFSRVFDDTNRWIHIFRRYFPYAVIPQLWMLAYAIGLRIAQYDITVNRYLVVLFGIWLFVLSLYFILSKRKTLIIIPATLTVISLLFSVWPWSVYSFSIERQYHRLMKNLELADMISVDGKVIPAHDWLDAKLRWEIYEGIHYICQSSRCSKLDGIMSSITQEVHWEFLTVWYKHVSWFEMAEGIADKLNVQKYYPAFPWFSTAQYYSFYTDNSDYIVNVSEYDSMVPFSYINILYDAVKVENCPCSPVSIDFNKKMLMLTLSGEILWQFPLHDFETGLLQKIRSWLSYESLPQEELLLLWENDQYKIQFIFKYYSLPNPQSWPFWETALQTTWYALIKKK